MEKIDLLKAYRAEYAQPKQPALVQTAPATYLAISGQGEPGGEEFQDRVGALYTIAWTAKMTLKSDTRDYKVAPLEGLWWGQDIADVTELPRELWWWTLLIRTPEFVTDEDISRAQEAALKKKKSARVREVQRSVIDEGLCVQMLHIGTYASERTTVQAMHAFANQQGYGPAGKHHEIYLSDPGKTPPEKLKTILRHPVAALAG